MLPHGLIAVTCILVFVSFLIIKVTVAYLEDKSLVGHGWITSIWRRIQEMSQGEPLLRGLARKLGEDHNIPITQSVQKISKHPYADLRVGERWMDYQGCNKWAGLLEPDCDPVLKAELLRYGEFAQATYDAFDNEKGYPHHYGTSKYTKADLMDKVGLPNRGYEIVEFIYTTTDFRSAISQFLPDSFYGTERPHVKAESSAEDSEHMKEDGGICEHDKENRENVKQKSRRSDALECKQCMENRKPCNWMGFVAVCTSREEIARLGRRDIVVAWRGSKTNIDWFANFFMKPEDFVSPCSQFGTPGVRVHSGFKHILESTNSQDRYCQEKSGQDQVFEVVEALIKKYQGDELSITVTGHSLGSALATLCAYDIALRLSCHPNESRSGGSVENHENGLNIPGGQVGKDTEGRNTIPITVFSFGGPRVGNEAFSKSMGNRGVKVLRVVNKYDLVTKLPGLFTQKNRKKWHLSKVIRPNYVHVGERLKVFTHKSDVLKKSFRLDWEVLNSRSHALETYLHLVDSYQGIKNNYCKKERSLVKKIYQRIVSHHPKEDKYKAYKQTFRDHALVNKHQDLLKDECQIPPCWLQEGNKGLVIDENGRYRLTSRPE